MQKIKYYRKDRQLGEDLIKLATNVNGKRNVGFRRMRKSVSFDSICFSAIEVVEKIRLSKKKGIKLEILNLMKNKVPDVKEIVIIAIIFNKQISNEIMGDFYPGSVAGEIEKICGESASEKLEVLKILSKESRLLKKGVIKTSRRSMHLTKPLFYKMADLKCPDELNDDKKSRKKKYLSVIAVKKELDKRVIGQERAKQVISYAAGNYLQAAKTKESSNFPNILIIGPSGSGKTHLIKSLAEVIDLPIVITDATEYTETGYVGRNVFEMLYELQEKMERKAHCKTGIIYIDEIDKISGDNSRRRDVSGRAVQEELLKILDNKKTTGKFRSGGFSIYEKVKIDTSKILFICGGAFSGLDEQTQRECGFRRQKEEDLKTDGITNRQLIDYGMMPEFIGRLPVRIILNELSIVEMVEILKSPLVSPINMYFEFLADKVNISEDDFWDIAERASGMGVGARGLVNALEEYFAPYIYEDREMLAVSGR